MNLANVARVLVVTGACFAAVGSATSNPTQPATTDPTQAQFESASGGAGGTGTTPPAARPMDGARALGLWRSTFGAVKIEADPARGGVQAGSVQGVWIYQRQGRQVIGDFGGELRGNVLQFHWREPGQQPTDAPLVGDGYLVFEPGGRQYSGRWWSERHDRQGDWNGWRQDAPRGGQPEGATSGEAQPSLNGTYPAGQPYPAQGQPPYPPPQQGQGQPYPPQGQPYPPPPPPGQPYLPAPQGGPTYYPPQGQPQPYPPYQPPPQQQPPSPPPQRGYY